MHLQARVRVVAHVGEVDRATPASSVLRTAMVPSSANLTRRERCTTCIHSRVVLPRESFMDRLGPVLLLDL